MKATRFYLILIAGLVSMLLGPLAFGKVIGYYPSGFFMAANLGTGSVQLAKLSGEQGGGEQGLAFSAKRHSEVGYGLSAGYGFYSVPIRLELNYARHADLSYDESPIFKDDTSNAFKNSIDGKVSNNDLMMNIYAFCPIWHQFAPYVVAGVGYAMNDIKSDIKYEGTTYNYSVKKTNMAYQAGLGMSYHISSNMLLSLDYVYTNFGKITLAEWPKKKANSIESDDFSSEQIMFHIAYFFGDQTVHTMPALLTDTGE